MEDNGASSYRRFLNRDWDGMTEIVDAYYDGLIKRKPEEIGEYQGKPVYDLQGIDEKKTWYEAIEE